MPFPSVLSTFNRPSATDRLNSPSHSALHNTISSAVGQLEAVIGVEGPSSVVGTLEYFIKSPASDGGGHVQTANKGGTGQTSYTKGDLLVGSSSSVLSKLAVGADTTVPVADSTSPTGVKWATASSVLSGAFTSTFPYQEISLVGNSTQAIAVTILTSDTTGTVLFAAYDLASTTTTIYRLLKSPLTANYYITHTTTLTVSSTGLRGMAVAGNYLYVGAVIGGNSSIRRYDKADLANVATMTGVTAGTTDGVMWSDNVDLYCYDGSNSFNRYSISGTAVTDLGAVAFTSSGSAALACISNGTNVWIADTSGTTTYPIRKYVVAGGAVISTTSPILHIDADLNAVSSFPQLFIANNTMLGIGWAFNSTSAAAVIGYNIKLMAIDLP